MNNQFEFIVNKEAKTVTINRKFAADERMERMIEMAFKEGFTMTLNHLEDLLATLSN